MKSKFGDYDTLNALAEQHRVQGGYFDPQVLMDRSPSKTKIHQCLMIEKVVNQIDELDRLHLKLIVMPDFMWALIEEEASNRAQHPLRKGTGILDGISESWTRKSTIFPQGVIDQALRPS